MSHIPKAGQTATVTASGVIHEVTFGEPSSAFKSRFRIQQAKPTKEPKMSKYDKAAIEAARTALHSEDGAVVLTTSEIGVIFDSLERAPWWREVTEPDEVIPAGCPIRREELSIVREIPIAQEWVAKDHTEMQRFRGVAECRLFIDTRWQPPVKPLAVGDVIETEEQAASLPVGSVAVLEEIAYQKDSSGDWCPASNCALRFGDEEVVGVVVLYLPPAEAES